jgi:hypothetical protein
MADITVTQNVLVPMMREVHISHFSAGKKNDFSSFIFNIVTAPCNRSTVQRICPELTYHGWGGLWKNPHNNCPNIISDPKLYRATSKHSERIFDTVFRIGFDE